MHYFNIQVASQLSGVASATIRAWEKRYNAVIPNRGENGHRLYSEKDIEKLTLLYRLTEVGQSVGKIAGLSLDELKQVYSKLMHEPYEEKKHATTHHNKLDFKNVLNNLYLALATYKVDIISHELEKAKNNLDPRDLCLQIIIPLFHEIGLKVERGEINIAQEHTLSALVTFYLGQMIGKQYQDSFQRKGLIIIATPEGEYHQIGCLAASLLCLHYGFPFIFMGASMPADSLAEAANALKCKAILLGVTRYELRKEQNLEEYFQQLESSLKANTQIWLGGNIKIKSKSKMPCFSSIKAFDDFLATSTHTNKR